MPDPIVVPIPADVIDRARAAMRDDGSNDAEHDALVEFVDLIDESRPFAQLLNDAADLLLEFHEPYNDHEAWRDAMNMLVNVAAHLAAREADQPPVNELDDAGRLQLLRDAIAHGWSSLDEALVYRPYFTGAVFASVRDDQQAA